jgi:hypothetical protein
MRSLLQVDGQVVVVLAAESCRRSAFGPDQLRLLSPVVTLVGDGTAQP